MRTLLLLPAMAALLTAAPASSQDENRDARTAKPRTSTRKAPQKSAPKKGAPQKEVRESTTGKKPRVVKTTKGTKGPFHSLKIAMALLTKARVDQAMKVLERVTVEIPEHAEAWHLYATCYELKGKRDKAHMYARKALELLPEHARASLLLARVHITTDPSLAADYARRANKNAGKDVVVARSAARILMESGNLDEAAVIVKQLAAKNPTGQRLLTLRAELALAQQDLENARKLFWMLGVQRPHDPVPHENIAGIYSSLGKPDKAIASLERALKIRPGKVSTRKRLIQLLTETGAPEDRIASERALLRQATEPAEAPKPRPRR